MFGALILKMGTFTPGGVQEDSLGYINNKKNLSMVIYTCIISILWILIMCVALHSSTWIKLINNIYRLSMLKNFPRLHRHPLKQFLRMGIRNLNSIQCSWTILKHAEIGDPLCETTFHLLWGVTYPLFFTWCNTQLSRFPFYDIYIICTSLY